MGQNSIETFTDYFLGLTMHVLRVLGLDGI